MGYCIRDTEEYGSRFVAEDHARIGLRAAGEGVPECGSCEFARRRTASSHRLPRRAVR